MPNWLRAILVIVVGVVIGYFLDRYILLYSLDSPWHIQLIHYGYYIAVGMISMIWQID